VYALGLTARWLHLASSILLVGVSIMIVMAGHSDRPTARQWERRMLETGRALALLALISGLSVRAAQTALFEGRAGAAFELGALTRVLLDTQAGHVWRVRFGFLLVLAAFLLVRLSVEKPVDWRAARGEAALLAAAALVPIAAAGHAAAAEPDTARAIVVDGLHVIGAGVWVGGLLPLAWLLRMSASDAGADARPYAVLAARRFSRTALATIVVLTATGVVLAVTHVGSVAGLVGTSYGWLLLAKLGLLLLTLGLAGVSRTVYLSRLGGDGPTVGRPAMRRLARLATIEGVVALAVLALVAALSVTPPARHEAAVWPFPIRLTLTALESAPGSSTWALVGSQVAVLGAVALIAAARLHAWRLPLALVGLAALGAGAGLSLPPLAVDAYPTTYLRPSVPYHAASIVSGAALYRESCASCHGAHGAGDGPAGRSLPRPPADLRAHHTAQHTAGDLFWWLTNGIPAAGMPGFGAELSEEQRWDLINFVRALAAGYAARGMSATVEPDRRWLVAPDFNFAVGPTPPRALKDSRGRHVLLVLYTLPDARPRLRELALREGTLVQEQVDIIAVPTDGARDAIKRLGADPRVLFSVVTEGADAIVATYQLFAADSYAEFLIDRQGYIRAIGRGGGERESLDTLLAQIQKLNSETAPADGLPEEHVH
jgi:putative copper resistance protein D